MPAGRYGIRPSMAASTPRVNSAYRMAGNRLCVRAKVDTNEWSWSGASHVRHAGIVTGPLSSASHG